MLTILPARILLQDITAVHLNVLWPAQCFSLPCSGNYLFLPTHWWLSIKKDIKWLNRFNLIFGQQKLINGKRFLSNSWFHRSFKSAKKKHCMKLSLCNLGKAIPLLIYLSVKKPSRCGCRKTYNQSLPLIKTLLPHQRDSRLFQPAKWDLHILVYNAIISVPFSEETLFSFLSVFDYCWAGATAWSVRCKTKSVSLRNTKELVQLLSRTRLASDSTLEEQTLHKLPVKANLSNCIPLKATIVLIHDWTAQTSFQMKKRSPCCVEQFPDTSSTLRAFQPYHKAFVGSTPKMGIWLLLLSLIGQNLSN